MTITQDSNLSVMLSSQLKQIDDIVKDILKLDLSIALDVVNKEKLIFLMLNIPNLLSYLEEQQGYDKISIEELLKISLNIIIRSKIMLSNELKEYT